MEPLYYEFRNIQAGVDVGFTTNRYSVPELVPASRYLHYITGFGILGNMKAQVYYPSGHPRNTVGANAVQRLDRRQANYLRPFRIDMVIVAGDTIEVDIWTPISYLRGAVWFYGWKFDVYKLQSAPPNYIVLNDVREGGK